MHKSVNFLEDWANINAVFVNNQLNAQFFLLYLFIPILYVFRATKCSSSGESIYQYDLWYMSSYGGDRVLGRFKPAYHTVPSLA